MPDAMVVVVVVVTAVTVEVVVVVMVCGDDTSNASVTAELSVMAQSEVITIFLLKYYYCHFYRSHKSIERLS